METTIQQHHVSRETWKRQENLIEKNLDKLENYLHELLWWNKKVNLVSRNADQSLIWQHISHSLLPASMDLLHADDIQFDAGTGGGLPGIPLAICNSNTTFCLNDINFKKITAVHQICQSLALSNTQTRRGSFDEECPTTSFTLVSKHSFKLPPLISFLRRTPNCRQIILYKGTDYADELSSLSLPSDVSIEAYHLDSSQNTEFYRDKAILKITSFDK